MTKLHLKLFHKLAGKKFALAEIQTAVLSNQTDDLTSDKLDPSATWPRKGCVTRLRGATEGNAVGFLNSRHSLGFKFREFDPKIQFFNRIKLMVNCQINYDAVNAC